MMSFMKKMSIVPKGLRYKTMVAFSLMSVIPLLICVWLVTTYIFPNINLFFGLSIGNISLILLIAVFISLLGLYITKEIIDPVVKIADEAKMIAVGKMPMMVKTSLREDEIGDLSKSLNAMTQKIKENVEELKTYESRIRLINLEINKKVMALSSVLQIGNLITSNTSLAAVLDFLLQKTQDIVPDSVSFVMLLDDASEEFKVIANCNIEKVEIERLIVKKEEVVSQIVIVDKDTPASHGIASKIIAELGLKNIILLPIIVSIRKYGILAIGNKKQDFVFSEDEKEVLNVFLKQASIAVENDILLKTAKELAVRDELTGLYNQSYIHASLNEEIKRSILYQRSCGLLLVDIDDFRKFKEEFGKEKAEVLLRISGELLKGALTEVDKVARLRDDRFAIVLPEKNKKQATYIAEEIRKKMESGVCKILKISNKVTVCIGVSENPIDGSNANELMDEAEKILKRAKSLGKNRVAV
ncbi:MAG: diguanylate cyclase [Candidatus Omnitrophica bacterium]|nr:diguanylate cyclase [Candidatus Omnitrophota bacterium]